MQDIHGPHIKSHNLQDLCRSLRSLGEEPEITSFQKISIDNSKTRLDKMGNKIQKNGTKHHVTFRDQILNDTQLEDIKIVENWKEYNVLEDEKTSICCRYDCSIF